LWRASRSGPSGYWRPWTRRRATQLAGSSK
jgi:hypothetical protein